MMGDEEAAAAAAVATDSRHHIPLSRPLFLFLSHISSSAEEYSTVTPRWETVSISLLQAELRRRQATGERPACGSGTKPHNYNVPLHVFALFLILALSTAACSFPLIIRRFPKLPVPNHALFLSRHFGTGVLIATAFVHLLPTAYTNLLDPCLPPFWTDVYPAMPGFIAMVSVIVVVGIEMFFATRGASHSHSFDFEQLRGDADGDADTTSTLTRPSVRRKSGSYSNSFKQIPLHARDIPLEERRKAYHDDIPATPGSAGSSMADKPLPPEPEGEDSDLDLDELDPASADDTRPLRRFTPDADEEDDDLREHVRTRKNHRAVSWADNPAGGNAQQDHPHHHESTHASPTEQRLILQCLMLEAGILFHSVFIGLAVSVSTGSAFVVLLIAISFHQTFEGLALGSRIASIASFAGTNGARPWLMCLMYGITTPIGQAIGLGVQGLYDPTSQFGLLMVGIMNAISSGLLLYAGLVQLLAEDFLSEHSYQELQGTRRLQACAAVVAGAFLMALVGVWA